MSRQQWKGWQSYDHTCSWDEMSLRWPRNGWMYLFSKWDVLSKQLKHKWHPECVSQQQIGMDGVSECC